MKLPIDIVPGTSPPVFRWSQVVSTLAGKQVVDYQEALSPTLEIAVERLITIAKQLLSDNALLRGQLEGMKIQAAAELTRNTGPPPKRVEPPTPPPQPTKKGKHQ